MDLLPLGDHQGKWYHQQYTWTLTNLGDEDKGARECIRNAQMLVTHNRGNSACFSRISARASAHKLVNTQKYRFGPWAMRINLCVCTMHTGEKKKFAWVNNFATRLGDCDFMIIGLVIIWIALPKPLRKTKKYPDWRLGNIYMRGQTVN